MTKWFVPGRIEVFGKHTDYAGGNVLIGAVDLGVEVEARASTSGFVAHSEHGQSVHLDPTVVDSGLPAGHWGRYVHTVLRRLTSDFGALQPVELTVSSNLPLASGMSSSSALLIGVALAVADHSGLRETDGWRRAITDDIELVAYLACVENGSGFKHLGGGAGVGTHGGSEDHAAILTGRAGHLLHYNFDPMALQSAVKFPEDWAIVVANSGVAAEKTGPALLDYNRCSSDARRIVGRVNEQLNVTAPNLHAAVRLAGEEAVSALVADDSELARRLEHFLIESERVVPAAIECLRDRNHEGLGETARLSQNAAETLLRNQVPATTALVSAALESGAWASTSFGAGFGGSAWAMVGRSDADAFAGEWLSRYRLARPEEGALAHAVTVQPSSPATRLDGEGLGGGVPSSNAQLS